MLISVRNSTCLYICTHTIIITHDCVVQRPMGLLPLLDEESKFPQASDLSLAGDLIIVNTQ